MKNNTIKRRTRITVETERLLLVKQPGSSEQSWCAQCEAQVTRITPETAATLTHLSRRAIYRWLETGQLHFTESADGCVAVCLNSLLNDKPANSGFTAIPNEITQKEKRL